MIRIDSDTHFTPLDAFADLDGKYSDQGPHVVALPDGRYRIDYPARAPFVPALIFSGLLERFPILKFGFFDVGIGWIPWLLDRLEMAYDARPAAREKAPRRPKDGSTISTFRWAPRTRPYPTSSNASAAHV